MKERLLDVLAWLAWLWTVGVILFAIAVFFSRVYDELLIEGETLPPSLFAFFVGAIALGPLICQWVLFYIITGFPRLLPWQRPEPDEEEWWNR